ncbi:hypothetical protein [Mesomycoplasma hyorhinis]|nr:hypothetical protein [Mesomycoplasma hyorhinis]
MALAQLSFDSFFTNIEELFDLLPNLIASRKNIKNLNKILFLK